MFCWARHIYVVLQQKSKYVCTELTPNSTPPLLYAWLYACMVHATQQHPVMLVYMQDYQRDAVQAHKSNTSPRHAHKPSAHSWYPKFAVPPEVMSIHALRLPRIMSATTFHVRRFVQVLPHIGCSNTAIFHGKSFQGFVKSALLLLHTASYAIHAAHLHRL